MNLCSKCGAEMNVGAGFCKICGSGLSGEAGARNAEKKARVTAEEKKGPASAVVIAGVLAAVLLFSVMYHVFRGKPGAPLGMSAASAAGVMTAYTELRQQDGVARIPLAGLADGKAHFYAYSSGGAMIKFFALRKQDGSIGVAFDACNACYRAKRGYRQQDDQVVCNNCGMAFRPEDVGVAAGGCNPIPVEHRVAGDAVIVKAADLEKGRNYF